MYCLCVSKNSIVAIYKKNIEEKKMRKLIFSIITIIMLASTVLFAQDDQKADASGRNEIGEPEPLEVTRRLSFALVGDSGYLSSLDQVNLFYGNEFSFTAGYSQNFSKIPWMTFGMSGSFFVLQNHKWDGSNWDESNYGGQLATSTGSLASYIGNVLVGLGLSFNFGHFGLDGFSAGIGIDTRARANFRVSYTFWRSENKKHFLVAGIAGEIYVVPLGSSDGVATLKNPETGELEVTYGGDFKTKPINLLWVQAGYGYRINQTWSTDFIAYFRTAGYPAAHYDEDGYFYYDTVVNGIEERYKFDYTIAQLFYINTTLRLGWNIRANFDKLGFWAGVRCTMYNLLNPEADPRFQTVLRAGIHYSFDISKL